LVDLIVSVLAGRLAALTTAAPEKSSPAAEPPAQVSRGSAPAVDEAIFHESAASSGESSEPSESSQPSEPSSEASEPSAESAESADEVTESD